MKKEDLPKQVKKVFMKHMTVLNELSDKLSNKKVDDYLCVIRHTGIEMALYLANFKCEHCKKADLLTIHHLIRKVNKSYINKTKFLKQRNYFGNIAILCVDCHSKLEYMDKNKLVAIKQEDIEKIKERMTKEV
jgi:transcription initiation factor IIE alpha subunit